MIKDGAPDDDVLEGLSKKLGRDWEAVARRLKFSNGEISGFDDENKRLADQRRHFACCVSGKKPITWTQLIRSCITHCAIHL